MVAAAEGKSVASRARADVVTLGYAASFFLPVESLAPDSQV
jgi:hypothetical protein